MADGNNSLSIEMPAMLSRYCRLAILLCLFTSPFALTAQPERPYPMPKGSAVAAALAFAHHYATPDALTPGKDRRLKTKLIAALGKSSGLSWDAAGEFFEKATFRSVAGDADAIKVETMEGLVREKTPQSRKDMSAKARQHADLLTTQFDLIEEAHHKPAEELVGWIVKNYQPGKPLGVIVICTRNTRRSMMGAAMGNVAASYYGLTDLRFYSGGTDPDAFNPRSIAALKEIGVEIEPTGKEAARGKEGNANPVYRVRWGKGLGALEFSKKYDDAHNPREGFAAVLVCSEADTNCPKVAGAGARIPVPYLDPKAFDGAPFEAAKYAERRDDEGRFMLCVLMQARRRLEIEGKLK
jgi:hypothetical protein